MKQFLFPVLVGSIMLAAGFWLGQKPVHDAPPAPVSAETRKVYVCPMHSHIVQDHPGSCPICGMDLVDSEMGESGTQIHVDTATRQKFGVRLATVERRKLTRNIHTYGTLLPDLKRNLRISSNAMGVISRLHAAYPGQHISAGAPLYDLYSEELLTVQNEYIDYLSRSAQAFKSAKETRARNQQMLQNLHGNDPAERAQIEKGMQQTEEQIRSILQPMERDGERLTARLKFAGFTEDMLHTLAESRKANSIITIRAPHACTVTEVSARVGMPVSAMTDIISCAESRHAWLEIVFYPDQMEYVREGDKLQVEFSDGTEIQTRLAGIGSIAEGSARTVKARMPIMLPANSNLGDHASIKVFSSPREVLAVPVNAVIRTGNGNYVMKALEQGHFALHRIIAGISDDEFTGVIDGLEAGDQVAVNGQFLLDSAASVADTAQRYKHTP